MFLSEGSVYDSWRVYEKLDEACVMRIRQATSSAFIPLSSRSFTACCFFVDNEKEKNIDVCRCSEWRQTCWKRKDSTTESFEGTGE